MSRYALWLLPDAPAFEDLERLIRHNQGRVEEPAFLPHITLVSGLSGTVVSPGDGLSEIPAPDRPLMLHCKTVERGSSYFHCLYLPVKPSPSLRILQQQLAERFHTAHRPFTPHISLAYAPPRHPAIARLIPDIPSYTEPLPASRIVLWNVTGPVGHWHPE